MRKKTVEFPCSICHKNVSNNARAILCECCNLWSHAKCNKIDSKDYKNYQTDEKRSFFCMKCNEKIIPFAKLNDFEFDSVVKKGDLFPKRNVNFTNFAPSQYQKAMFNKLNKEIEDYNSRLANDESESDYIQPLTCNYYDTPEFVESDFNESFYSTFEYSFNSTAY